MISRSEVLSVYFLTPNSDVLRPSTAKKKSSTFARKYSLHTSKRHRAHRCLFYAFMQRSSTCFTLFDGDELKRDQLHKIYADVDIVIRRRRYSNVRREKDDLSSTLTLILPEDPSSWHPLLERVHSDPARASSSSLSLVHHDRIRQSLISFLILISRSESLLCLDLLMQVRGLRATYSKRVLRC